MKKLGKKILIVNRLRPENEMIELVASFLLDKQMKVNQLLAQTDEIKIFLDKVSNSIAEMYSGMIEIKTD